MRGKGRLGIVALMLVMAAQAMGAEWQPPKDRKLTEKQVTTYIAISKELVELAKSVNQAAERSGGAAAVAIGMRAGEKYQAILKKHGMSEEEFSWTAGAVFEAFGVAEAEALWMDEAKSELAQRGKEIDEQIATAKKTLADHEAALKEGKRILTAEQRQELIAEAKSERESAEQEATEAAAAIKEAKEEAAKLEQEAAAAEAAAKNPPADMEQEERAEFIKEKQEEAKAAREAAAEARQRADEAQTTEKAARARAQAAAKRAEHPELPANDEEKAELQKEHQSAIALAKTQIEESGKVLELLKESGQASNAAFEEMRKNVPAENIALLKKHRAALKKAWQMEEKEK